MKILLIGSMFLVSANLFAKVSCFSMSSDYKIELSESTTSDGKQKFEGVDSQTGDTFLVTVSLADDVYIEVRNGDTLGLVASTALNSKGELDIERYRSNQYLSRVMCKKY